MTRGSSLPLASLLHSCRHSSSTRSVPEATGRRRRAARETKERERAKRERADCFRRTVVILSSRYLSVRSFHRLATSRLSPSAHTPPCHSSPLLVTHPARESFTRSPRPSARSLARRLLATLSRLAHPSFGRRERPEPDGVRRV